ncbi:MAG: adenylate/guanylate cyclase domain-containing protein [Pseudomonadota bacterium]
MNEPPAAPVAKNGDARFLVAVGAIVIAVLLAMPLANRLEPVIGDLLLLQIQKVDPTPDSQIVIVAITEETLAGFPYRSPIDRGFLADLVTTIDAASPRKIGLDILLDASSEPKKDKRLIEAISNAISPVVFATAGIENGLTEAQHAYLSNITKNQLSGSIALQRDDIDGVLRHLPILRDGNDNPVLGFADVLAGEEVLNTFQSGRVLYRPPTEEAGVFPKYPAHNVKLLPPDWFKDKYVIIGVDLPHTDRHPTPYVSRLGTERGSMSGSEIHAHILSQKLANRSLPSTSALLTLFVTAIAAIGSAIGFGLAARPRLYFSVLTVVTGIYVLVYWAAMSGEIWLLPLIGPVASAIIAALLLSLWKWRQDRFERTFLETAFGQYVSPAIVDRLTAGNIKLKLGGEKRQVTYIFTDLEGFTSLSQTYPPEEISQLLNTYLDAMCDLVTTHGATIDKIIGDAVVCFIGAPGDNPEQAGDALKLALAMDRFCEEFRTEHNYRGIPIGITRIGVHMGDAVIGNFGGKRFFDYTGIGDTVNTAARLEGANRYLGTRICVSESVVELCGNTAFRPLGELLLKGRNSALPCFEPCSDKTLSATWMQAYLDAYRALELKQADAIKKFEIAASENPEDGPTQFHIDRLKDGNVGAIVVLGGK